jgi:RNA-directed DNA polymerase
MPYAEMDNITSSKLILISERARKDPKFQFTSLAHLLNEGFLKECYYELGRDRACGIDGVSWKEYGEKLDENISNLVSRLKSKRYRPLPAKRIYVSKNEHEKRPLGLPMLTAYCTSYNSVLEHQTDFTTILDELQTHSNNFFSLSASSLIQ